MDLKQERRLIQAARKNKKKFGPLYEYYKDPIYNFFKHRVDAYHTAEELTSNTFIKALKGIDNYQWQGMPFSSWLFRIARNTLIDHYRGSDKRKCVSKIDDHENKLADNSTPSTTYETMVSEDALHKVIESLPSRERDIIYMKFFDGYTNKIIAELTDLSETNVGTIIYRTLRKLRDIYSNDKNLI